MPNTFVASDSRGQWLVITDASTADEAQITDSWIKTTDPVELEP